MLIMMRLQLPWWVLVSTGSYLLFEIGWGLYTFNDVPKAYDDLMIVGLGSSLSEEEECIADHSRISALTGH